MPRGRQWDADAGHVRGRGGAWEWASEDSRHNHTAQLTYVAHHRSTESATWESPVMGDHWLSEEYTPKGILLAVSSSIILPRGEISSSVTKTGATGGEPGRCQQSTQHTHPLMNATLSAADLLQ